MQDGRWEGSILELRSRTDTLEICVGGHFSGTLGAQVPFSGGVSNSSYGLEPCDPPISPASLPLSLAYQYCNWQTHGIAALDPSSFSSSGKPLQSPGHLGCWHGAQCEIWNGNLWIVSGLSCMVSLSLSLSLSHSLSLAHRLDLYFSRPSATLSFL